MKRSTIFFIIIFLLSISSCTKDKLPKATESGKNTFGCKIDGNVFLPSEEGSSWVGARPIIVSNSRFDGFVLRARKFSTSTSTPVNVVIALPYLITTGTYTLATFGYGEYKLDYAPNGPIYRTNQTYTGTVTITRCDTVNRIYSGTFSFKALDENTTKIVNVTDGRFDVKRQ